MTREELDFIGSMNMCDEIRNEAYKKIVCHCGEQEPCEDVISRQAALNCFTATKLKKFDFILYAREEIKKLPSVNPQPKTGHWIRQTDDYHDYYECEHCGIAVGLDDIKNYCPNCGCRMVDPQESEG